MTREEHLLTILAEECVEVAQRATKILRFGMDEVQPGQSLNNADRMLMEYWDVVAAMKMLEDAFPRLHDNWTPEAVAVHVAQKREKVERFLAYSSKCGTITE